jgi:hypothetical protein
VRRVKLVVATAVVATVVVVAFVAFVGVSNAEARSKCNTTACHMRVTIKPHRAWLRQVGACETRGMSYRESWRAATGNGYYGRFQFDPPSWRGAGGEGMPHEAAPQEQRYRAVVWMKKVGRGAWPNCG